MTHAQYVALRDGNGLPIDPVLLMQVSHGARIDRVLEGYRPRDSANGGAGVLIAYTLEDRHAPRTEAAKLAQPTATASGHATGHKLEATVQEAVERVLGAARRSAFQPDRPLTSMGLESLDLLELRRSLGDALGVALDPTFFFRHGTPDAIVRYFDSQAAGSPQQTSPAPTPVPAGAPHQSAEGFAVVGLSCQMPGAEDAAAFWRLLARGGDSVTTIAADRWRLFEEAGIPLDGFRVRGRC